MLKNVMAALVVVAMAGTAWGQAAKAEPKSESAPAAKSEAKPKTEAQARFEKLKALAGVWQTGDADNDGTPDTTAIYRVTSGGSAVAEYLMPGTDHEMISMYHLDGDTIVMTHYCAIGNQPRLKSKAGGPSNVIGFDFVDGTNMKSPADGHMHSLVLTFKDDDTVSAAWSYYENGTRGDHSPTFELKRVKDADAAAKIITTAATACCAKDAAACCESGAKDKAKN